MPPGQVQEKSGKIMAAAVEHFDDIILGGGKGGKSLAMALGPAGHKVALIERGQIGGTCINVACIPTKTMVASTKLIHAAKHADSFGVRLQEAEPSLAGVLERKRRVVQGMIDTHKTLFATTANMEFILGTGKFVSPKEIEIAVEGGGTRTLTADRIYLNTGSRTAVPSIPGLSDVPFLTSTSLMELSEQPSHLVIIGAGYIALEFAQVFARLGSRVTVLMRGDRFLPREDEDIAQAVKQVLEDDGVVFKTVTSYDSVEKSADGVHLKVGTESGTETVSCSHLMVAIGRNPNTKDLNLEAAGVKTDDRGNIVVNEKLQTTADSIWAIGDCNGVPLFTHASWDDYRIIRDNVLHNAGRSTTDRIMPYTLFVDPELGRVGLTEQDARKRGLDILVAKIPASKVPRAVTSGEPQGLLKAVVDKQTKQILGCSLLCHSAGEVMSVVQMAMIGKVTYPQVANTIFTHPTMAESLNILFATLP